MTDAEALAQCEAIERVCSVAARRGGARMLQPGDRLSPAGEGVEWRNPATDLMEAEDAAARELVGDAGELSGTVARAFLGEAEDGDGQRARAALEEFLSGKTREMAFAAFEAYVGQLVRWLFADGLSPLDVVKRLFAFAKMRHPDVLGNLGFRELGTLLFERGATLQARVKRLFGEVPAGWKKTATARAKMARAQKANVNRRGGKKVRGAIEAARPGALSPNFQRENQTR